MIKTLIKEIEVRNKLLRTLLDPDINGDFYNTILNTILEVAHSKYGLIGYLDPITGANICPTMTYDIWDECNIPGKTFVYPHDTWGGKQQIAWVRCLEEGITVLNNSPSHHLPEGHVPLTRSICIPLKTGKNGTRETIGIIIMANKETDYTLDDVEFLEKLAETIGPMVELKRHDTDLADYNTDTPKE
jgi:GAF domain-containing protein